MPTIDEIVGLVVGDIDSNDHQDIIVHGNDGQLQHIHELYPLYLPLQYPILFPYGEDDYCEDIMHNDVRYETTRKNHKVTICEYIAYCFQIQYNDDLILIDSRRLMQ